MSRTGSTLADAGVLAAPSRAVALWRAVRPHHWLKNVLVVVPVLAAHRGGDGAALRAGGVAFAAFSLVASAGYLVNDLFDARTDQTHPRKRARPIASGALPRPLAAGAAGALIVGGLGLAATLPRAFLLLLGTYAAGTVSYTALFRRRPLLDVLMFASFYTARLFAGGFATGIPVSEWMAMFGMFVFLSLAFLKRAVELVDAPNVAAERGYRAVDREFVTAFGAASALVSVVVLALYCGSQDVRQLYGHPHRLWGLCPLVLYGLAQLWFRAQRGEVADDPLVATLTDRMSWVLAAALAVVFAAV